MLGAAAEVVGRLPDVPELESHPFVGQAGAQSAPVTQQVRATAEIVGMRAAGAQCHAGGSKGEDKNSSRGSHSRSRIASSWDRFTRARQPSLPFPSRLCTFSHRLFAVSFCRISDMTINVRMFVRICAVVRYEPGGNIACRGESGQRRGGFL